jgi:hypothetical protein
VKALEAFVILGLLVFFSGGVGGLYYWAVIRRELPTG